MSLKKGKRPLLAAAVVSSALAIAIAPAAFGCAPSSSGEMLSETNEPAAVALDEGLQSTASLAEWAEAYPQEFASYNTNITLASISRKRPVPS